MTTTTNEKLIGIETMKSRISSFHASRCERLGLDSNPFTIAAVAGWTRSKIIREFRELPENCDNSDKSAVIPEDMANINRFAANLK